MLDPGFDAVMLVPVFSCLIWWSLKWKANGAIVLDTPDNDNKRSQDLPQAFHDVGQWYWFRTEVFMNTGVILGDSTGSIELSEMQVRYIDTEQNWALAEIKQGSSE